MGPKAREALPAKEAALFRQIVRFYEMKQYKKGLKAADQILKCVRGRARPPRRAAPPRSAPSAGLPPPPFYPHRQLPSRKGRHPSPRRPVRLCTARGNAAADPHSPARPPLVPPAGSSPSTGRHCR